MVHHYLENDVDEGHSNPPIKDQLPRFEIRTGKFGQYFHDRKLRHDMTLAEVAEVLNQHTNLRSRVAEMYEMISKIAKDAS